MLCQSQITCARACLKTTMQKMLFLMTVVLIISVANAGTSITHQKSKRNDMNQCLDNPCQNGGTFTQKDGCFTCSCTDGWTGARCNEAVSNLALNKPAKQSSRFTGEGVTYYANLAVDGNNGGSAKVAHARGEVALIVGTHVVSSRQHPQMRNLHAITLTPHRAFATRVGEIFRAEMKSWRLRLVLKIDRTLRHCQHCE
uniref:EGF-like domain-containing protein n=1 Tax=Magallana gigas TaxID=29159 RepID=A0A8W8MSX3_MAGGI